MTTDAIFMTLILNMKDLLMEAEYLMLYFY